MELYAKGQLSFLILNCLLERDFYGLDIISEIRDRSNGRINLKKPSVYSNLTRMEKQGFVSAYLKSSDLGPNRKYYSVTEKGRSFFNELKEYFDRNNVNVFRDFSDEDAQEKVENTSMFEENINQNYPSNETQKEEQVFGEENLQDDDYFDFSTVDDSAKDDKQEVEINEIKQTNFENFIHGNEENKEKNFAETNLEESPITEETKEERVDDAVFLSLPSDEDSKEEEIQDIQGNSIEETSNLTHNEIEEASSYIDEPQQATAEIEHPQYAEQKEEVAKDDAVFLSNENASEYNQKLYDISKDINKYKKKKSFAEDQISITVDSPLYLSNEKTKANIEEFKNTFTENVNKIQTEKVKPYDFSRQFNKTENTFIETKAVKIEEPVKDDAKYITGRIDSVERARKIEPPRLKINEAPARENRLPAPKRDTAIDPSHKEILSRLYSRTKDNVAENVREDAIYDYSDLKDFYNGQNIEFNEYKRPEKKYHNTNKLYFILSLISLIAVSVASALLYVVLFLTQNLFETVNFLYIVLPALVIIDVIWKLYNYKKFSGWLPEQIMSQWKVWGLTVLISIAIILINIAFGFGFKSFDNYSTTLLLPLTMTMILIPGKYYLKRFMLVKFWR